MKIKLLALALISLGSIAKLESMCTTGTCPFARRTVTSVFPIAVKRKVTIKRTPQTTVKKIITTNVRNAYVHPIKVKHVIGSDKVTVKLILPVLNRALNFARIKPTFSGNKLTGHQISYFGNDLHLTLQNGVLTVDKYKDAHNILQPTLRTTLKVPVKNLEKAQINPVNNTIEIVLERA